MTRRVLLIENSSSRRIVLGATLRRAGHLVDMAETVSEGLAQMGRSSADIVVLSGQLPDPTARSLPAMLAAGPAKVRTPVVVLAGPEGAGAARLAHGPQVDAVLDTPVNDNLFLARIRSVLRVRDMEEELIMRTSTCREMGLAEPFTSFEREARVLIVQNGSEDPPAGLTALISDRIATTSLESLVNRLEDDGEQDVLLLSLDQETIGRGLSMISDLRCRRQTRHASIVVQMPAEAQDEAAMALDLGASDVLLGNVEPVAQSATIRRQIRHKRRMERLRNQVADGLRMAITDPLTGLYNRRYALSHLERLSRRVASTGRQYAVMVLDLDHFKAINDTHGHAVGDTVLVAVARKLQDNLRGADLVARFGGEEFLIAMPDTDTAEAQSVADRLRTQVAALEVPGANGKAVAVTLSIGLAVRDGDRQDARPSVARAIDDADKALYGAKTSGRNMVILAGDSLAEVSAA